MNGLKALVSVLILAFPLSIQGQENPEAREGSGEEMILFQEIPSVYGASRYDQRPAEAPASITVITADEIQRFGYRTLAEILRSVRGFFVTYDRNYSYVGVRGFGRPGDYNTRVLLLLDGHRINDNVYDQAAIGTESIVAVDTIDRVEIIRGPSSSLYGTSAFFAVVNVVTRSGRQLKGAELRASAASYATLDGRAAYGNRAGAGGEAYVYGSYYRSGGQNLYFREYDDPATNEGWASDDDRDRVSRFLGKLSLGGFVLEAAASSRTKQIPTGSFGTVFDDPRTRTVDRRAYLSGRYDRPVGERTRFSGSLSYDVYRYYGDYAYPGSLFKDYGYGQWWTGEAQTVMDLSDRQKVIGGAEYRYNSQQDQGGYDAEPFFSYLDDRRSSRIWAVYAQDEIRLRENFILSLGVRRDDYQTFGGTLNPRFALIYTTRDDMTVKFLFGRAFRAPNAYELYYEDGGTSQKANPALDPESIDTYQLEIRRPLGRSLQGTALVYHYGIKDLISLEVDPADSLAVFRNIERVDSDGIELELEGRLAPRLEGRASYAYQRTEDRATGTILTNSPRHLAKLNFSLPLWKDRADTGVEVQYVSRRENSQGGGVAGYALVNLNVGIKGWRKGPSLDLGIYNLFDRSYGDPGGEEHLQGALPQDGRSYRLQARYEF
jgi:iron complex outermembrane receptor protein